MNIITFDRISGRILPKHCARRTNLKVLRRPVPYRKRQGPPFSVRLKKWTSQTAQICFSLFSIFRYYGTLIKKGLTRVIATQKKVGLSKAILLIPMEQLISSPYGLRKRFDSEKLRSMAESIRHNGILQPLTVKRIDEIHYEVVAGERRFRAAQMAGLSKVPCIEIQVTPPAATLLTLIENLQREDLTCFEEAEGLHRLIHEWGVSQEEAAKRLGKAQSTINNKLRLLKLSSLQRERIETCGLSERHARTLLRIPDEKMRDEALNCIISRGLSVSESDQLITKMLEPQSGDQPQKHVYIRDVRLFVNTINHAVETMRRSGVPAKTERVETEGYIEYIVRIPKQFGKVINQKSTPDSAAS